MIVIARAQIGLRLYRSLSGKLAFACVRRCFRQNAAEVTAFDREMTLIDDKGRRI